MIRCRIRSGQGMNEITLFDRLLIAQSRVEGATLLSRDALFHAYGIDVVW